MIDRSLKGSPVKDSPINSINLSISPSITFSDIVTIAPGAEAAPSSVYGTECVSIRRWSAC